MLNPEEWPAELDALIAAPRHHLLLFENECVRVIENRVGPGEIVALHTHCWPATLYVLSWSDIVRRDDEGAVLMDSRTMSRPIEGAPLWSTALPPHTLENVGETELRLICVEVKGQGEGAS